MFDVKLTKGRMKLILSKAFRQNSQLRLDSLESQRLTSGVQRSLSPV